MYTYKNKYIRYKIKNRQKSGSDIVPMTGLSEFKLKNYHTNPEKITMYDVLLSNAIDQTGGDDILVTPSLPPSSVPAPITVIPPPRPRSPPPSLPSPSQPLTDLDKIQRLLEETRHTIETYYKNLICCYDDFKKARTNELTPKQLEFFNIIKNTFGEYKQMYDSHLIQNETKYKELFKHSLKFNN